MMDQPDPMQEQLDLSMMQDKLEKLSSYVRSLFEAFDSSATRAKILGLVKDSRRAYYQETEPTNFPWLNASNMIAPLTTMGVDEVEPRLVAAVIGRQPYIKAKNHLGTSTKQEAEQITKFDNFILEHKVKVASLVPQLIHEELIDGTIYPMLSWETNTKRVRRNVQDPNARNGWSRQIQDITMNGPCVELVPVEFVWHEDNLNDEDWERANVIRYVGNITTGDIKRRSATEDGWMVPEDLDKYAASTTLKTTQQTTEGVQDYLHALQDNQRPIEFYEAYVKYDLFGDDQQDENLIVLVEVNSFEIFRVREQIEVIDENIKPLRRMRFLKRRGISWGYPLYTLIAGIQLGVDAMWNRCINSADITMTPWGFIKRGISGLRQNKIAIFPGNMIEVDNPDAINFPNLTAFQPTQFIPLILQYISFFERTLNVTDFMQGRESAQVGKKGSTATGTLAILQEGKIKFEYRGGLTHLEFLELFKNIHDLCVSNMSIEEHIKIVGAPIVQYSNTEEYIFELVGSDLTSNRFVDRQETESFVMTMQPFITMLNPMTLVDDILLSYEKDLQDYINPELNKLVTQWMTIENNVKGMTAMGIPEPLARQAAQQGFTPENAKTFIEQMGKMSGQATQVSDEAQGGQPQGGTGG
jgi:hypothetical protein